MKYPQSTGGETTKSEQFKTRMSETSMIQSQAPKYPGETDIPRLIFMSSSAI